jgi:hypothetical protein
MKTFQILFGIALVFALIFFVRGRREFKKGQPSISGAIAYIENQPKPNVFMIMAKLKKGGFKFGAKEEQRVVNAIKKREGNRKQLVQYLLSLLDSK